MSTRRRKITLKPSGESTSRPKAPIKKDPMIGQDPELVTLYNRIAELNTRINNIQRRLQFAHSGPLFDYKQTLMRTQFDALAELTTYLTR